MHGSRSAAIAACTAFLLAIAGCGTSDTPEENTANPVRLYGSDGNMINSFGDQFKDQAGLLAGMKGTTPMTPLSDDFKKRLRSVDQDLGDFVYAGESYDAVVISSLAAELAGSTSPGEIAKYINGVTTEGERCDTPKACLDLARAGRDIEYRGVSLKRGGFTDAGEPSTASYATMHFDSSDRLDDGKTEFVGAGDEATTTTKQAPAPRPTEGRDQAETGAPLKIGGLLPQTGDLALANPPLAAGSALAIRDVNAAGGVLGQPVEWVDGDDGTNPEKAKETVASHVAAGVHVIIGAGASGISRAVLPDVVKAGLILFSPCNTDAGLSEVDDQGLYFRTAPSDLLQGKALADVIMRDGSQQIAIVARKDSYGEGLQGNVRAELEKAGIDAGNLKLLTYDPPEDPAAPLDFGEGANQIRDFKADAVLVIGYGESANVIKALVAAGVELRQ
ncbi:ABC transporter substrate-binding protein [Phytohabitans kaempferiae]|uniref:ABC transporter substrate-binding protein n=1 Tax=Phytohabitans kaempferiae TaxID=1620943 RepID=A0ABV6LV30_9ACTN